MGPEPLLLYSLLFSSILTFQRQETKARDVTVTLSGHSGLALPTSLTLTRLDPATELPLS